MSKLLIGKRKINDAVKAEAAVLAVEAIHQLVDAIGDGHPIHHDVVDLRGLARLLDEARKRLDQLPGRVLCKLARLARSLESGHTATENVSSFDGARTQLLCRILVLLVLEQATDELLARVHSGLFFDRDLLGIGVGNQLTRLEVTERGRHHEVFGRDVDRHVLHEVEVFEVFLGDERDRDVDDFELVGLAEEEQEIERSLELGQHDVV